MAEPWIIGVSSGFHNGAACLLHGAEIIVAIQEERLTRVKRARVHMEERVRCIDYCLETAGIRPSELDMIVNCTIDNQRKDLESELRRSCIGRAARANVEIACIPHHLGHAASAYVTSGFGDAVALVIDGGGSFGWQLPETERAATLRFDEAMCEHMSIYLCSSNGIIPIEKHLSLMPYLGRSSIGMKPFASLGHMFSSVSLQIFGNYLEAGKVMGLAPYGHPIFPIEEFFEIQQREFVFSDQIVHRFAHNRRWPDEERDYVDLAASVQGALEHGLVNLFARLGQMYPNEYLCYSGGVALNSVANRRLLDCNGFRGMYVIPAAEDSGTAIGAAYYGLMRLTGRWSTRRLRSDSLGRKYAHPEIDRAIQSVPGLREIDAERVNDTVADLLASGNIVGWFCGGSEFGPRALGNRSILCDPRPNDGKQRINDGVKHRESFRPFAPIILREYVSDWFCTNGESPLLDFMLEVCPLRDPLPGPAVPVATHIDRTGRVQVIDREANNDLFAVITRFHCLTGVPMLVNTSMNIMGEPIVETPREALWLLLLTDIDYCILDGRILCKRSPEFSVLDLVPYLTCGLSKHGTDKLTRSVSTPGGNITSECASDNSLPFLSRVDGRSSCREIFAEIDVAETSKALAYHTLSKLLRFRSIDFKVND
jgi:carbamoyltransferase